jgi:hypothetical protein
MRICLLVRNSQPELVHIVESCGADNSRIANWQTLFETYLASASTNGAWIARMWDSPLARTRARHDVGEQHHTAPVAPTRNTLAASSISGSGFASNCRGEDVGVRERRARGA